MCTYVAGLYVMYVCIRASCLSLSVWKIIEQISSQSRPERSCSVEFIFAAYVHIAVRLAVHIDKYVD